MNNTGIILTLAYPDTIVRLSEEWFLQLLRFVGIGKKNYLRAGHAALVLIDKETGVLEYHDFGRYITSKPNGRVRGSDTDNELHFPIKAIIENDKIKNLDAILSFLSTNPKLTHGDGKLVASVCNAVDYKKAKAYITKMQDLHFIKYAAFFKGAFNCAHFVTDTLIDSVTNLKMKKQLENSKWFTPSTIGNVLLSNTEDYPYEVSDTGIISRFKGSQKSENLRCFLDRLKGYEPNFKGNLEPVKVKGLSENAQWLSGIGSGAWFELHQTKDPEQYRYRRISPYGHVDVDAIFVVQDPSFNYDLDYKFVYYSNCKFFNVKQGSTIFKFDRLID